MATHIILLQCLFCLFPFLPTASPHHNNSTLQKRWYTLKETHPPLTPNSAAHTPWPQVCTGTPNTKSPIRFCYRDKRSADNLTPIMNEAIARWAPGMVHSTLDIGFDYQGPDDAKYVFCDDPRVADDALQVFDHSIDGEDDHNWDECDSLASFGYIPHGNRGRHFLQFCGIVPGWERETYERAVASMMHELGHAIGFQHEHQRNDRNTYLTFTCSHLEGYAEGIKAASIDAHVLFDDDARDAERAHAICSAEVFARAYLPAALQFVVGEHMEAAQWGAGGLGASERFDYGSIMIYDSTAGSVDGKDESWMLTRDTGGPVWMGGAREPGEKRVSAGDVARVAQLYPLDNGGSVAAMEQGVWGEKGLRVRVRGFETTVYGMLPSGEVSSS